ncbi:MAG: cytochrome c [Sulfurospirillaceae bacterium]|nr:cytochrome c [Sulfurospirillaceae bacterium]MDD3462833.1 cytochrome c [Sulfurospirillaceae bacterium]
MGKSILVFLLILCVDFGLHAEDFITKMEYAKMLYSNPRGIGCNKCHGEKGEGAIIATYKEKGKKITLKAPPINAVSKDKFFESLSKPHKVMPTYFLTANEIESLYYYVSNEVNK